ncbi:MAG: signal peptidase II [Clostridia bacterium]|nr:signal peptidase II [Clostridia bacterium]
MKKPAVVRAMIYTAISIGLVLLDQFTKWLITITIPYGSFVSVIGDFFSISHVLNTGAAWGVLSDYTWLLSCVTFVACLILCYLIAVSTHKWFTASYIMILSGALGNLVDRIFRGEVVDFLSFRFGTYDFPSFNVADICITCGCILLMILVILPSKKDKPLFKQGSLAARFLTSEKKSEDSDASVQ